MIYPHSYTAAKLPFGFSPPLIPHPSTLLFGRCLRSRFPRFGYRELRWPPFCLPPYEGRQSCPIPCRILVFYCITLLELQLALELEWELDFLNLELGFGEWGLHKVVMY